MTERKYICRKCGHKSKKEIISREEVLEKKLTLIPVVCPKCGSREVEKI